MTDETNTTGTSGAVRTPSAIDAVADSYTETLLSLDPSAATYLGLPGHETEYRDYSPAGARAFAAATSETLGKLASLEPTDDVDRVTVDAMRERLGLDLEIHDRGLDLQDMNNIASPAQEIREIFDLMPTDTAEHWAHIAGRMANVPDAVAGYIESLRTARDAGNVAAARQVRIVIDQARKFADDGGFFDDFASNARLPEGPVPDALAHKLDAGATSARKAYADLAAFLQSDLLNDAPDADAVGRDHYALHSRQFLGSAVDLDATYEWGLEELDRVIAEQREVAEQIKPGATIDEAMDALDADPARVLHGTDALRAWMQDVSDTAVRELLGAHFEIPEPMRALECRIAPTNEGGVYYTGPSDDFARPGRMWWSVPDGEDSFTTWRERTTVYHEGVPGHHLQIGTATYRRELLNDWRRNISGTSGHAEGWALYAERLMADLGYLDDPGDRMGMLVGQRMRAARVVFDIGVHLGLAAPARWGGGTWTAENGYEFLRQNLAVSRGELDFEFNRYLGWPGQAPSYKIGQQLWEQIRDDARARAGADFDLKAFHTRALNVGSVGLDTLRRALIG